MWTGCPADFRKRIGKDLENANGNRNGASANGHRYVFGDFEIDPANRECLRACEQVHLTSRVFDILLVFVENPGRLLEKDELIEKVWRGDYVEEGGDTPLLFAARVRGAEADERRGQGR